MIHHRRRVDEIFFLLRNKQKQIANTPGFYLLDFKRRVHPKMKIKFAEMCWATSKDNVVTGKGRLMAGKLQIFGRYPAEDLLLMYDSSLMTFQHPIQQQLKKNFFSTGPHPNFIFSQFDSRQNSKHFIGRDRNVRKRSRTFLTLLNFPYAVN